ncbi:MAG: CinA family nicotinamide mononucleotide deamidase-related protein [Lentisphaeria bacterium]|nr:CinA family nicotinamide mononucleotide deamidase-related protein [Lentisphaeria bacterium]
MPLEIICLGTELLTGETLNTNLQFLGSELDPLGIEIFESVTIPDEPDRTREAILRAFERGHTVITVGGLGPTQDDMTRDIVAETLGDKLHINSELSDHIRGIYQKNVGHTNPQAWERQASFPEKAIPLFNHVGTAPGMWYDDGIRRIAMLPGPPNELKPMFRQKLLPILTPLHPPQFTRESLAIFGLPESKVEHELMIALKPYPGVEPAFCIKRGKCHVRLTVKAGEAAILAAAVAATRSHFGYRIQGLEQTLAGVLIDLLKDNGQTLGTIESCTGGGIGAALTGVAGSSAVYMGGFVTYSNEMKMKLAGVKQETLAEYGAVSSQTAIEMVEGAAKALEVDACIAVTGIAGPGGGTPEKPVGTVHIATYFLGKTVETNYHYPFEREDMRKRTADKALSQLREQIEKVLGYG